MHPHLLSSACQLYATSPDLLTPLSGGHTNAVYKFPLPQTGQANKFGVLRIGVEDCPIAQTLGMLEWVRFLRDEGAPVTAPLLSTDHHLLESLEQDGIRYIVTAFENAEGILAENIPPSEWTDDLFCSIGKAAGKLHRISRQYKPTSNTSTRPMWYESYEVQEATRLLAYSSDPARDKLAHLIDQLKQLPTTSPADFGLIHDDLHFANFLIQPDDQVAIIDFDDCVFGWFAMDVSMALFDILVLYNPCNEAEKGSFAHRFLSVYISGYRKESDLSPFWQERIPSFLKLKELCIYADLIGHYDIEKPGSWVGRFMRDRTDRIANDIPYVDIDFVNL